jgi:hypothetical protein
LPGGSPAWSGAYRTNLLRIHMPNIQSPLGLLTSALLALGTVVDAADARDSWRRFGTPLLFDGAGQPKPAFDAVIAEARKAAVP